MAVQHTYLFATLLVCFFLFTLLWPCIRRFFWRSTADIVQDIEERLMRVQDKQQVMEERQKEMKERQKEILALLRQLKREGSVSTVANHEE